MQKDLTRFNLCPFGKDAMSDELNGKKTEGEETAHFILMLRYLALLIKQCQVTFSIPKVTVCLREISCRGYTGMRSSFTLQRENMLESLLEDILVNSGWSYGKGKLKEKGVSDVKIYSKKNVEIEDWNRAVSQIPDIFKLERKGFCNLRITVCWNERIARYHNYVAAHPKEVELLFQEETAVLERILRKMADPYSMGIVFCSRGKDNYVMGFFEGNSDERLVSIKDINYNFFVQAIILHMLLTRAEEVFGLLKWKEDADCEA